MSSPHLIHRLFIIIAAVVVVSASVAADLRAATKAAEVDAMFAPWDTKATPGAAVLVIRDGRVLLQRTYGMADLEAKTTIAANSAFQTASISKQFTAMAVLILTDRGKLHLDDTLSKFFPSFPEAAHPVTVRQLLNHTSGLREYDYTIVAEAKRSGNTNANTDNPTLAKTMLSLEHEPRLRFAPGTRYEYCSSNYVVLAAIVEQVTHERLAEFLKRDVFDRLGMSDSIVLDERHVQPKRKVASYNAGKEGYKRLGSRLGGSIYGDMNVFASLNDFYKWDQALYTERLVRRETIEQAFTSGHLNDGTEVGYGFGWQVRDFLGLPAVAHSGWALAFRTFILRIPSEKFSVVVLANSSDLNANVFAANIAKIYLRDRLTYPKEAAVPREAMERLVGKYETREGLFGTISLEGNELRLNMSDRQWRVVPQSQNKYFLEGREEETVEVKPSPIGDVDWIFLRGNPVSKSISK